MTNKKAEIKRVLIFVFIAFVITWIPEIIMNKTVGFEDYFFSPKYTIITLYSMLTPAIANVLTRLITKEGWGESYLHLHLQKNVKYYLFAAFFPAVGSIIGGILISIFFGKLDFGASFKEYPPMFMVGVSLTMISMALPQAFYCFGEEFGWRAYLYPKLEKLMGVPGAVIIGGIIWGVWHAPLTVEGHNFGTDYRGYPWLGVILMCIFCILIGAVLMWLTKKTGSVYPAAIAHAVNNGANLTPLFANDYPENTEGSGLFMVIFIPTFILGTVIFILMLRQSKNTASEN